MINSVYKSNGTLVPFDSDKLNRWARFAAKQNVSWSELSMETYKRLEDECSTADIHQTMINVCLSRENLQWSRVAARLEYATLRKNMQNELGVGDKDAFRDIYDTYVGAGLWTELPEFNERWELWYEELMTTYFEYWQVKQWVDKYSLRINENAIETPHMACLAIGLSLFGDTERAFETAKALVAGQINLPTPALNGIRNGDYNSISCCIISGGDSVDSIGVAEHIAYKMTAKKAGIGIEYATRSIGDKVKGGSVKHLGKVPIYAATDKAVKMFTQVSRGGSATVTFTCIDPEIETLLLLKSQRTPENKRIDKLDYSFAYNEAFLEAVIKNEMWDLYSLTKAPEVHEAFYGNTQGFREACDPTLASGIINARELLKLFLTVRGETGRVYCFNATRSNHHTAFSDTIRLSNLCQEIFLPTKAYVDMPDLYSEVSQGETAFCTIAALNVANIDSMEYASIAELCLRIVDKMIDNAPMMSPSMEESLRRRRSVGIGITGLAGYLYAKGMDYDGAPESIMEVRNLAAYHYMSLLKASQLMAREEGVEVKGITDWLPIDTAIDSRFKEGHWYPEWEVLRGIPRKHSVIVAHMPTESSAVFSNATNGVYPVRRRVIEKQSRKGKIQYIAPEGNYKLAWDIDNNTLAKYYSVLQDFCDQGISADYYQTPSKHPGGKIPMSQLMKEWVVQAKLGIKSMYYINTNDNNGGNFQEDTVECEGGVCSL